jgi:predicted CopG family antitoxin
MYRAQILLADGQYENLSRIARNEHRSVSELVREMLAAELTRRAQTESIRRDRHLAALEAIAAERRGVLDRRGGRPVELESLLADLRNDRDDDLLQGLRRGG